MEEEDIVDGVEDMAETVVVVVEEEMVEVEVAGAARPGGRGIFLIN